MVSVRPFSVMSAPIGPGHQATEHQRAYILAKRRGARLGVGLVGEFDVVGSGHSGRAAGRCEREERRDREQQKAQRDLHQRRFLAAFRAGLGAAGAGASPRG